MNNIKKYIIPSATVCLIFILMLFLRTVPVAKLWKGFSVLYVPVETEPKTVLSVLDECGCKDTISYYNQSIPFLNPYLPVKADYSDSYLSRRNSYFFDKDRKVMIYYVPDAYSKQAAKAVNTLIKEYKIDAGLDGKSSFPLVTPIICIIAAVFFFLSSKQKKVFFLAALFPLIYAFVMPFYINASSVCLCLFAVFLCQKVWRRKNGVKYVVKNPYPAVLFTVSLISSFVTSFVSGFLFMLTCFASILILSMLANFQKDCDSKLRFNPVLIRPARLMNMICLSSLKKGLIAVFSVTALFVLYITSVNLFTISNSQDLSFPMPTRYNTVTDIPDLDDYVVWSWNTITLPYRSLNEPYSDVPEEDESITIQRFKNTEDGVKTTEEVVYKFNSEFKDQVLSSIDMLEYPAIEKLMKQQGRGYSVDYSYGTGEKFSKSNIILMLIMIIVPCGMLIYYLGKRKRYGNAY